MVTVTATDIDIAGKGAEREPYITFQGIFDGNSHTLTLNYAASEEYAALFRYVYRATIKNLHVTGNIATSRKIAAGMVGHATGACYIENCRSGVTISMTITGCIFNGELLGSTTTHCGGLIGYANGGNSCEVRLNDCLFAPAEVTFGTEESATLLRSYAKVNVFNCFYTVAFGCTEDIPPSYALTTLPASFGTLRTTYSVSGIKAYTGGMPFNDKYYVSDISFYNDASNDGLLNEVATSFSGKTVNVRLYGRTLYQADSWNSLCLPFSLNSSQIYDHIRNGFNDPPYTLMELDVDGDHNGRKTGFARDGTLYLFFKNANYFAAGRPYMVKWGEGGKDKVNRFLSGVTINNGAPTRVTSKDGRVSFVGTFSPHSTDGEVKSMLYFGAGSTLYYPDAQMTIGAFRAYFKLKGITAGDLPQGVRSIVLNFLDDDDPAGITAPRSSAETNGGEAWYSLDGHRLKGRPTARGIYIKTSGEVRLQGKNGRTIVIK